jgi:hypothetical protein
VPQATDVQSSINSALLSAQPWGLGVLAGVLTLALGEGAADNHQFLVALHDHWILWLASSCATMITGTALRGGQKFQALQSGAVDNAIAVKATEIASAPPRPTATSTITPAAIPVTPPVNPTPP